MYFHHPNKKKTGKRVALPSSKKQLRLKIIYRLSKKKLIWGCSSKCSVANDTDCGNENYSSKMRTKQRHKMFLRKCLDQEGETP